MENISIGILGGGQLGAMLIRHAIDFGLDVSVLDKNAGAPAARHTSSFHCGDPMSYEAVMAFGKHLDIITIEKEAVNTEALHQLAASGVKVLPAPGTIDIIRDKYVQKKFLEENNIPVARGISIADKNELNNHIDKLPACIKKRRNGYDGNGVMVLKNIADIDSAFDEPSVLEELVDIEQEISVIVARNQRGETVCYDLVAMVFDKQRFILDYQMAPALLDAETQEKAKAIAVKIAESLHLAGILAVEMFITKSGDLIVNELAPRPHNSGHHTIEACITSQYEQHLRAVLDMPLGDTSILNDSIMVNILERAGDQKRNREHLMEELLAIPGVHVHWYGKKNNKEGRKIGHVTITRTTREQTISIAQQVRNILNQ